MAEKEFPEIKKKNKGKFTRWVKKNMKGASTCDAAATIVKNKKNYDTKVVEMANYANNFGCKKEDSKKAPTTKEGLTKEQKKTRKKLVKKEKAKAKEARKTGTETTETYEDSFYMVPTPKGGF